MGKPLLILSLAVALLTACDFSLTPGAGDDADAQMSLAHSELACAACHRGPTGERGRPTVPEASCTSAGCHEAGGPEEVQVATVTFHHRDHGETGDIQPTCAGCHTHPSGEAPLEASVDACALCHLTEVTSGEAQECRLCHEEPDHSELTSQGVVVSHSELPWIEVGCVRCHYDVSSAQIEVNGRSCRQCHDDMEVLNQRAVGRDLHPIHDGITCSSCHASDVHEVRAMSSVVQLACSDCHSRAHDVTVEPASDLCAACHEGVHSAQQRLILGVRPDSGVTPSAKFLAGITCRSCHIPPEGREPTQPIRGQAESCSGCHPPEYEQVLPGWEEGLRMRLTAVGQYLDRASRQVASTSDSARVLMGQAREMVALVREAGGQHNLELSDQLMRDAVDRIQEAYAVAGRQPPSSPDLGRAPHVGLCSYCHYESTQMWNLRDMPEDFHRTVLGEP